MNRSARRPFLVLVLALAISGGWFGAPWLATSIAPAAQGPAGQPSPGASPRPEPTTTGAPDPGSTADPPSYASPAPTPAATPVALPTASPVQGLTASLKTALDTRLEKLRQRFGIPGMAASILFPDGSIWEGVAGLADVGKGRRVTSETAFAAASVSKTFTAALILSMVEQGRVDLDARARTYLPDLAVDRAITVRMLLDHTSGLRDYFYNPSIDHALLSKPARVWDAARSLRYVRKSLVKPGRSWSYSNTNYLVLGMLAEAVDGRPLADQLRDRFFGPLGLEHTWYQSVEAPRGPLAHGYRFTGTDPALPAIELSDGTDVSPFTSVVTASGGAGSIATTPTDLVRWARALYAGAALTPDARAEMLGDVVRTAPYKPTVPYGLGVQAIKIGGRLTLGHSGRFLGARASVRWIPEAQLAVSVMTNQSRSDPAVIVASLLRLTRAIVPT